jgi:sarcosine oxidase subunit beta
MACAYELARSGVDVALFERRGFASGTTGGSAGVMCLHDLGELYAVMTLVGYERIRWLQREHDFAFHQYGALSLLYSDEADTAESAFATKYGSGPESIYHRRFLSSEQLAARYPWLPADVRGAAIYPNQGFINPYELVDLYRRLATATGRFRAYPGTPVLMVERDESSITRLITRRGLWDVDHVINAAGPWGAKVARLAGSEVSVIPQRIQVAVATGYDDGAHNVPLVGWPAKIRGEAGWCRGEEGDMLLFGQHHHVADDAFTVDPDNVNMANDDSYPELVAGMIRRHWKLPTARFMPGWNCIYGSTPDGYPILGADSDLTNLIHVLGCNGHGITMHAALARAAATLIMKRQTMIDLSDVPNAPAAIDVSWLRQSRFAEGRPIRFDTEYPTPTDQLV